MVLLQVDKPRAIRIGKGFLEQASLGYFSNRCYPRGGYLGCYTVYRTSRPKEKNCKS